MYMTPSFVGHGDMTTQKVDTALPQSIFVQVGQKFPIGSITAFSRLFQSKPLSSPITPFHMYLSLPDNEEEYQPQAGTLDPPT